MKHPKPDIATTQLSTFLGNTSTVRKLLRYWGTETIDGVEVLRERQYYHPIEYRTEFFEKLFRFLGVYEDINASETKGIKSAWFYFNKNREEITESVTPIEELITKNLNLIWWDSVADGPRPEGLTLTTVLLIEGIFQYKDPETTAQILSGLSKVELIQSIKNNYEWLWNNHLISQQGVGVINKGQLLDPITKVVTPDEDDLSPDDAWMQTLTRYALRNVGVTCTIKDVEIGFGRKETGHLYPTYSVTLEIPYTLFSVSSPIVTAIAADLAIKGSVNRTRTKLSYSNAYYTKQALTSMGFSTDEDDTTIVTRPYIPWEANTVGGFDHLWHSWGGRLTTVATTIGSDGNEITTEETYWTGMRWALRADVFRNPSAYGMKYKELVKYVLPLLDTNYKKKKVPVWKKIVIAVVTIVAVVFSLVTGGYSLTWIVVAYTVLAISLAYTLLSLAAARLGAEEWGTAFAEMNKSIQPLVYAAMIYIAWTGLATAYDTARTAAEAAATAAGAETAAVAIAEVTTVDIAIEFAKTMVMNTLDGLTGGVMTLTSTPTITQSVKLLTSLVRIFNTTQQLKLKEINERNKDRQAEYEKITEEAAMENDILAGFARISASPATADWSIFASLYDLPYEASGGLLHTGNVLRTTKQALRKANYDDPVFANILIA